jgi:acyl carrier protein
MENQEMFDKVVDIICKYTEVPKEEITLETNMLNDLGLASIDFIDMICDFEEEFEREVPERDFRKLTTVQKIVEYVAD